MTEVERLKKRLLDLDKKISSMPIDSVLVQGWQTQKYSKLSRSRDILAQEFTRIRNRLDEHGIEWINGQFVEYKKS